MTNDDLILDLLEMVRKWQRKAKEYHLNAINWRQSADASYNDKRYKHAKSDREYAIRYEAACTNIYKCMREVGGILYNFGIIKSPHIGYGNDDIQAIEEAIKQYTDKLEADNDTASYICMAGYEEA